MNSIKFIDDFMEIQEQLRKAGLSKSESRVYLYILENGLSTPPQIAKGTSIARTNTYHILRSLKEKELVEAQTKGKRAVFLATDPSAIVRNIEERKVAMESILPDLRALYTTQKNKPKIKFYEGWKNVEQIYNETLTAESVLALGSTEQLNKASEKYFHLYRKELKKRHIIFRDILTHASEPIARQMMKEVGLLYTPKLLPKKFEDFPTDLLIWGDNVALISLEEPMFGTVLTNKNLARTYRIMFEIIWQSADKVE